MSEVADQIRKALKQAIAMARVKTPNTATKKSTRSGTEKKQTKKKSTSKRP